MKKSIIITYKNGSTINIDVPETFYIAKYKNKPEAKIHKIFMKQYSNFVSALNKTGNIIKVSKYLPFSSAIISAENVLGVDIKVIDESAPQTFAVKVPGVHDKTYLDISETSLDTILKKLETTNLLENIDTFIKKVNSMMSKNNVQITIKAGAKKKTTSSTIKKKNESVEEIIDDVLPVSDMDESMDNKEPVPETVNTTIEEQ